MIITAPCFAETSFVTSGAASTKYESPTLTSSTLHVPNSDYVTPNYFSGVFSFYTQVIAGGVAGALFSMKFAIEVMHSAMNDDSNPNGLKRAILRFFTHVIVVLVGATMIFIVIGVS